MGFKCVVLGHKDQSINFWGDEAEYILNKCKRCGREEIYCYFEGKLIPNDEMGRKILDKMMNDKEFSKACHIHYQFVKAEQDNVFNFKKQDEEFDKIRKEFNLPASYKPACPVEMFKSGLWKDKKPSKTSPKIKLNKTIKGESKPKKVKGENPDEKHTYTNEVKPMKYGNYRGSADLDGGETLEQLERLEKIYAAKEDFERAAWIYERIKKIKNKKE